MGEAVDWGEQTVLLIGQDAIGKRLQQALEQAGADVERAQPAHAGAAVMAAAPDLVVAVGDAARDGGRKLLDGLSVDGELPDTPTLVVCGQATAKLAQTEKHASVATIAPHEGVARMTELALWLLSERTSGQPVRELAQLWRNQRKGTPKGQVRAAANPISKPASARKPVAPAGGQTRAEVGAPAASAAAKAATTARPGLAGSKRSAKVGDVTHVIAVAPAVTAGGKAQPHPAAPSTAQASRAPLPTTLTGPKAQPQLARKSLRAAANTEAPAPATAPAPEPGKEGHRPPKPSAAAHNGGPRSKTMVGLAAPLPLSALAGAGSTATSRGTLGEPLRELAASPQAAPGAANPPATAGPGPTSPSPTSPSPQPMPGPQAQAQGVPPVTASEGAPTAHSPTPTHIQTPASTPEVEPPAPDDEGSTDIEVRWSDSESTPRTPFAWVSDRAPELVSASGRGLQAMVRSLFTRLGQGPWNGPWPARLRARGAQAYSGVRAQLARVQTHGPGGLPGHWLARREVLAGVAAAIALALLAFISPGQPAQSKAVLPTLSIRAELPAASAAARALGPHVATNAEADSPPGEARQPANEAMDLPQDDGFDDMETAEAELSEDDETSVPKRRAAKIKRANQLVEVGHRMYRSKRLGMAEAAYLKALRALPAYPRAMAGLARVHLKRRDGREALRWAKRLTQRQPNRGNNQLLLGDAYKLRGKKALARRAWRMSVRYGNRTARRRLGL